MSKWIYLGGAPSLQAILSALNDERDDHADQGQGKGRWLTLDRPSPRAGMESSGRALYAHDIFAIRDKGSESIQDMQSEAEVQSVPAGTRIDTLQDTEESRLTCNNSQNTTDSLLPPPTQYRADRTAEQTTEQSLLNLPNWSFSLPSITSLSSLSPSSDRRVNLLVFVSELELPTLLPLKKRSLKLNKMTAMRAGMRLFDESGSSIQVVMWDEYAERWAGEYLKEGDIAYFERILLSEYKGQWQGSTTEGSKLQICYRTQPMNSGHDDQFRPDLDLAWDPVSKRVKALMNHWAS